MSMFVHLECRSRGCPNVHVTEEEELALESLSLLCKVIIYNNNNNNNGLFKLDLCSLAAEVQFVRLNKISKPIYVQNVASN